MLWPMSLSSIFLNSSSMRSQIKAELEAVARSLFHSPRTNSLKASPVCAQIKSLMNIFAKHQKSGWCWSSAQPRPWRFGWKDSAATSKGARALQSCGDTASSCHCSGVTGCPSAVLAGRGHSQGWVLQGKGENLQGCSAQGQTADKDKGRIRVSAHLAGDPKAGLGCTAGTHLWCSRVPVPHGVTVPEPPGCGASPGDPVLPQTQPLLLPAAALSCVPSSSEVALGWQGWAGMLGWHRWGCGNGRHRLGCVWKRRGLQRRKKKENKTTLVGQGVAPAHIFQARSQAASRMLIKTSALPRGCTEVLQIMVLPGASVQIN